jgi:hypothetical protein
LSGGFVRHCPREVRLHERWVAPNGLTEIAYCNKVFTLGLVSETPFKVKAGNLWIKANCCIQVGDRTIVFAVYPKPYASIAERTNVRRIRLENLRACSYLSGLAVFPKIRSRTGRRAKRNQQGGQSFASDGKSP